VIVDSAIYVDGRRSGAAPLEEIHEASHASGGFAWVGLYEPTEEEFGLIAGQFGLGELGIKNAIKPHQRPKVENYRDTVFVVLKAARYLEEQEAVEFGEIHAFVGPDFVVTMHYGEAPELDGIRGRMEGEPELLRKGPFAVLYTVVDRVVDDYGPVADGLENDIDEIEVEVFGGYPDVSRRIYELSREVIEFHQATQPLAGALVSLTEDGMRDAEVRRHLRGVRDRALRVTERVEGFRELLSNILTVNFTIVGTQQNDQTKKISAWAAILIVPTLIAGIYGMNFDYMPELHWMFGYPLALSLMVLVALLLYLRFKRSGWL